MGQESRIKLNIAINIENSHEYIISPFFNRHYKTPYNDMAKELFFAVNQVSKQLLQKKLPEVILSFDQNGVNSLLEKLNYDKYKVRNYTFIDDWAIKKEVRESPQYIELVKKIEKIPYVESQDIGARVFLKTDFVTVNATIVSYDVTAPTLEQCDTYLENYKITEGKYKLDSAVYTKPEAVKWVKKNITVESAVFKAAISVDENSGFRISFKY